MRSSSYSVTLERQLRGYFSKPLWIPPLCVSLQVRVDRADQLRGTISFLYEIMLKIGRNTLKWSGLVLQKVSTGANNEM